MPDIKAKVHLDCALYYLAGHSVSICNTQDSCEQA